MVNYQEGKMYKIVSFQTDKIYVGSTCDKSLASRMSRHRCHFKRYLKDEHNYITSFEILKYDDAQIILIENFPCNSRDELLARERYHIEQNKEIVINKMKKPYTSDDEEKQRIKNYQQKYYENNKEKLKENVKKNVEKNIDKIKEYQRQYKKKMIGQTVHCPCGGIYRQDSKKRHEQYKKHQKYLESLKIYNISQNFHLE